MAKFTKRINNQGSSEASATEPMLNVAGVEEGNEQTQIQLNIVKDFINRPSHSNKVLNIRDFSGKSDSFCLQQTSLCKDVFYIFAIDMEQKLDDPPRDAIEGRKWKKLRGIHTNGFQIYRINILYLHIE